MDIEDYAIGFFLIIEIIALVLIFLGIYTTTVDNKKNTNDYQKCICEKVEE